MHNLFCKLHIAKAKKVISVNQLVCFDIVSQLLTKFVTGGSNWPAEQQLDDVQVADVGGPDEGSVAVVVLFQQHVDGKNENNTNRQVDVDPRAV